MRRAVNYFHAMHLKFSKPQLAITLLVVSAFIAGLATLAAFYPWWFYSHQTLIVGLLGFFGVGVTLVVNNREALAQRNAVRLEKQNSLRVAISEDLEKINGIIELNIRKLEEAKSQNKAVTIIRLIPYGIMLERVIYEVPILTPIEVKKIFLCYNSIGVINNLISITNRPAGDTFFKITFEEIDEFIEAHNKVKESVELSKRHIDSSISIKIE